MFNFKKTFLVALCAFMACMIHAQIRSYVGVVRQQYFPEHVSFLQEYKEFKLYRANLKPVNHEELAKLTEASK